VKSLLILLTLFALLFAFGCWDDGGDGNDEWIDDDDYHDPPDDDDDIGDDDDDDVVSDDDDDDDTSPYPDGCVTGDFEPVFGMFHAHSIYSDGRGLPTEAFEYARDVAELDFFTLSDHMEILHIPVPPDKLAKTIQVADQFNDPGTYVALAAWEYSLGIDFLASGQEGEVVFAGHNNVFFVDYLYPMIMFDYHDFYDELLGCESCISQFNHPSWEGQTNWNDFEYLPQVDAQMHMIEMSTWNYDPWPELFECLDAGWHVSPNWSDDTHEKEWGTLYGEPGTGAWVSELTRSGIREVMEQHRTFSTLDRNATIKLMAHEDCWMGSELQGSLSAPIDLEVFDPDAGDGFISIELYGPGMELLGEVDCLGETECAGSWDVTLTADGYLIARAIQLDDAVIISAPIWLSE
jgi:large repetitive protein